MRIRLPVLLAALLLVALAPLVAWARSAERVLPGQKIFGTLGPGESVTILVDCVSGTPLGAKAVAYKGTTTRLDMSLADPDGASIDIAGLKKTNSKASFVSFAGLKLTRTGTYRLLVSAAPGTQGGFDLTVKGAAPKKTAGTGAVGASASGWISFEAVPGDSVVCTVKPAKKSKLKPLIVGVVDAEGAATAIDPPARRASVAVATMGATWFEVSGADSSVGAFTWSLKFTRAKAGKSARDAEELNAVGTITGVVVVDGNVVRTSVPRGEKALRKPRAPDVRPGEIIVAMPQARSRAEVEAAAAAAMSGATCAVVASLTDEGPYLLRVERLARGRRDARAKSATRALARTAEASGSFAWSEANGVMTKYEAEANDQLYGQQFHLRQIGMPFVWDRVEGDPNVVVAIVDTGMTFHPDLIQRWLPGYDFVLDPGSSADGDGWDDNPTDAAGDLHGLHVAGIVGARANNKIGVSGVLWNTRLVPVRVLGRDGGTWFDVAAGVRWAAGLPVTGVPANDSPARVINMSLGGTGTDAQIKVLREAVAAVHAGTTAVIVAAAGNEASSTKSYPAAFPNVIAVYALDVNQMWATYSNYGDWITVGAPGGDPYRGQPGILSTFIDPGTGLPSYEELSGTSMASPQVAGVVALMISLKPSLQRLEITDILTKTARDLGPPGFDTDFGWGMVDARAAIDWVLTPYAPAGAIDVTPAAVTFDGIGDEVKVFVRRKSSSDPFDIYSILPTTDVGIPWMTVTADHMQAPATLTVKIDPTLEAGVWTGKIRLDTFLGIVDVPVRVVRTPQPKLTYVVVSAVDDRGNVVARTSTTAAKGWAYELPDLPLGRCQVTAVADMNGDLVTNRVDEWEGVWPLLTQPQSLVVTADSLDTAGINVPITRYDSRFSYRGVGLGHVAGALAVRAVDARSDRPIAGANVYLGGGLPQSVTDARGRGAIVAGLTGGQFVTVNADGYGPTSRVGQDAQYQGFALEPTTAPAVTTVVATVRGLTAADHDVWLQVGDARGHLVYLGGADPSFTMNVTSQYEATPVSAVVFDSTGYPTRHALSEALSLDPAFDVTTTALPVGGQQARFVQPSAPTSGFTTAGATLTATTSLRMDGVWTDVGTSALAFGQSRQGWWADPGTFTPALPMRFEALAADPSGRTSRRISYGTTADLQPSSAAFTLDSPALLTAPAGGATNVPIAPTFAWTSTITAGLHKVVIEEVGTTTRWTLWVPGSATTFVLPTPSKGALKPGTNYRWSVETLRFAAGFDAANYREERLDTEPTSRTFSGWATFKTQ